MPCACERKHCLTVVCFAVCSPSWVTRRPADSGLCLHWHTETRYQRLLTQALDKLNCRRWKGRVICGVGQKERYCRTRTLVRTALTLLAGGTIHCGGELPKLDPVGGDWYVAIPRLMCVLSTAF